MYKKVITICMAMAAFAAFAMSASASAASPLLTNAAGTAVPVGTNLVAVNTGETILEGGGVKVQCSNDVLTGTLTANPNNGKPVEGEIHSASFLGTEAEENCKSNLGRTQVTTEVGTKEKPEGIPWCLKATTGDVLQVFGGACGKERALKFTLDVHSIIGVIKCNFERTLATGPVTGTYNTKADLFGEIAPAGSKFVGTSGGLCPTEGTLQMKFDLTEDPSGTLTMD